MANSVESVTNVTCTEDRLIVDLVDGRSISVPIAWYQSLLLATPRERDNWKIVGGGYGIHWPSINEYLYVEGLLRVRGSRRGSTRSYLDKALNLIFKYKHKQISEIANNSENEPLQPISTSARKLAVLGYVQDILKHRKFILTLAGIMVFFLFVASPMELNPKHVDEAKNLVNAKIDQLEKDNCSLIDIGNINQAATKVTVGSSKMAEKEADSCQALLQGLSIQLGKANNEIQSRLNQESEWFKIKYLYVGVILLGFLINTYFKASTMSSDDVNKSFKDASESFVTSFILSITVIVAVSIDMQIRAGRIVINQLGSWIYHYAEPIFLGKGLGWEAFLRLPGAYHANNIYTMTFWPNIYFLSIGLYALYLVVTEKALAKVNSHEHTIMLGFWMLHITLLVAALSSHVVPFTFLVSPHPLLALLNKDFITHPGWLIPIDFVTWLVLIRIAFAYIGRPFWWYKIKVRSL